MNNEPRPSYERNLKRLLGSTTSSQNAISSTWPSVEAKERS